MDDGYLSDLQFKPIFNETEKQISEVSKFTKISPKNEEGWITKKGDKRAKLTEDPISSILDKKIPEEPKDELQKIWDKIGKSSTTKTC